MEYGETVENAVSRELFEETGLEAQYGELLGVYSDPDRDPRKHIVTVAFVISAKGKVAAGDDAQEAKFHPLDDLPELAFDHAEIVEDYLERRVG